MQIDIEQYFIDQGNEKVDIPPINVDTFLCYHGVLRRHQQIDKNKLKILTNLFHSFLTNSLRHFLHSLSQSPSLCQEYMPVLLRLPRLLANIQQKPQLYNIQQVILQSMHLFNLQCQLKIIEIVNVQDPEAVMEVRHIIIENIQRLPRKYSYFQQAFKKNDNQMLTAMSKKICPQDLFTIIDNLLYSSIVDVNQTDLLHEIAQQLPQQKYKQLFRKVLFDWSTASFVRVRVPKSHKVVTNVLLKMMELNNMDDGQVITAINEGVFIRFQHFKQNEFVCQAAAYVLKKYAQIKQLEKGEDGISLEDVNKMYAADRFREAEQNKLQQWTQTPQIKLSQTQLTTIPDIPPPSQPITDQQPAFMPVNLYDCQLALNSENRKRREGCLKQLPKLIREHPGDLAFCYSSLTNNLLHSHDETHVIPHFSQMKIQSLVALLLYKPIEVIEILTNYFYKDRAFGHKILLMQVIEDAIRQLSQNQVQVQSEPEQFYFKRVESRYFKPEKQPVKTKQPQSVRRWGHTKIAYQKGHSLLPLKRQQLLVRSNNYNRFYTVCDQLFFRFLIPLRNQHKQLRDNLYCSCLINLLIAFAENIRNYHEKYKIMDEMLDLHDIIKVRDIDIQKRKLTLLYKISCILDQNIANHQLFLSKLMNIVEKYQGDRQPWFDGSLRMILGMVCQNVRQVLPRLSL